MTDPNRKDHVILPTSFLLAVGCLSRGHTFYGPFSSLPEAIKWSEEHLKEGLVIVTNVVQMSDVREPEEGG